MLIRESECLRELADNGPRTVLHLVMRPGECIVSSTRDFTRHDRFDFRVGKGLATNTCCTLSIGWQEKQRHLHRMRCITMAPFHQVKFNELTTLAGGFAACGFSQEKSCQGL
jgi:hypothetical protein